DRHIITNDTPDQNSQRGHRRKRKTGSDKHGPRVLRISRHRHRRQLSLITHLGQKDDPKRRQQHTQIHSSSPFTGATAPGSVPSREWRHEPKIREYTPTASRHATRQTQSSVNL